MKRYLSKLQSIEINYVGVEQHLIDIIDPFIKKYVHIVPPWVRAIFVKMLGKSNDPDISDIVANCDHLPEYGMMRISLGANLFTEKITDIEDAIIHEMTHGIFSEYDQLFFQILKRLDLDSEVLTLIQDQQLKLLEHQTVHVTQLLKGAINGSASS